METDEIPARCAAVRTLLAERLRIRATTLSDALERTGRLLPRRLCRAARTLADAELLATHPKLRRSIDLPAIERAHVALTAHLEAIDPVARRRAKALDFLAFIALIVLIVGAGLVAWLRWRGLV